MFHIDLHVLASYHADMDPPRGVCAIQLDRNPRALWGGSIVRPTGVGPEASLPAALAKALTLVSEHGKDTTAVVHVDQETYDTIAEVASGLPSACQDAAEAWKDVASLTAMLGDRCQVVGDLDTARQVALERMTGDSLSRAGIPLRGPRGHY